MRYISIANILAITVSTLISPAGARDTLKDRARARGGKTSSSIHVDLPFSTLADGVERASVVIRAQIHTKESRLTPDGNFVRTYYTFSPTRVFKDTVGISPTRGTPQATVPLVFFELGGVVNVEGLEIRQSCNISVTPPLSVGDDVVLLLEWDKSAQEFLLQNGPYGLLRVHGGTVSETTKGPARGLNGKRVSELETEIQQLVKGVPVG